MLEQCYWVLIDRSRFIISWYVSAVQFSPVQSSSGQVIESRFICSYSPPFLKGIDFPFDFSSLPPLPLCRPHVDLLWSLPFLIQDLTHVFAFSIGFFGLFETKCPCIEHTTFKKTQPFSTHYSCVFSCSIQYESSHFNDLEYKQAIEYWVGEEKKKKKKYCWIYCVPAFWEALPPCWFIC